MCGFTIVVNKQKTLISNNIKREILNSQHHRGPDFAKKIERNNIVFFHNRLSIIDLSSKANQPMICKNTGNIIVFNGEIYNYKELKVRFFPNHKFNSNSDTEVLLELYRKFEHKFLKYLNGMFSIVIYDNKKKELFLARDHFGIKPLNYYEDSKFLICSTEVNPINIIKKKIGLNYTKINEYLNYGLIHHDKFTFFEGIKKVKEASFYKYDVRHQKFTLKKKYWALKKNSKLIQNNYKDFKENYKSIFQDSLKLNLVSDVPIALLLSSGADSSYIYNELNKINYNNLKSFSFGWKEKKYDESIITKKNLNLSNSLHKILEMNLSDIYKDLSLAIKMNEGPIGGFGTLGVFKLMKLVNQNKIKVAFSGEGSDELNLGYFNQHVAFLSENYNNNSIEYKMFKKANNLKYSLEEAKNIFLKHAISAPDGTVLGESLRSNTFLDNNSLSKLYISSLKLPKLLHWQDRCGGAFGIETRFPFLNHELATYCFSNPDRYKIRNGITKYHLRDVKLDINKKKFVVTPQREFIKKNFKTILDIIDGGELVKNDIINFNNFKKNYKNYSKDKTLGNSFFVWKVLNLELFLQLSKN